MSSWAHIARRIRVPVGFAFAAFYLWQARPSSPSLILGTVAAICGLALRAFAAGHLRKSTELTTTGPYGYTRNPLYLGSLLMAGGFALAARNLWIALAIVVIFVAIYVPVVGFEENYLRSVFPAFEDYARAVPRFLPRLTAAGPQGQFSFELYLKNREYNALLGTAAMLAALVAKLVWYQR